MKIIKIHNIKEVFVFTKKFRKDCFLLSKDGCSILLSKREYRLISQGKINDKIKTKLERRNMFENQKVIEEKVVKPTFYLIEITQQCNLNCNYCFRGEHNSKVISYETLEKVLENIYHTVKENNIKNFSIQPWGGEPLLYIDRIAFIRNYFNKLNLYPNISVETNGIMLNLDNFEKLLEADIHIGLSIDGVKEIQDFQRPFIGDGVKSSSDIIEKNILKIKEKYPLYNFGSISVYTSSSLPYIKSNIEYLYKKLFIKSIKFNVVKDNSFHNGIGLNENQIKELYLKLYKIIKKYNEKNMNIVEANIFERTLNLLYNYKKNICISSGCMGGYKMVAYSTDGELYNCELIGMENQKIGGIKDDIVSSIRKNIDENNPYYNEKKNDDCLKCPWWQFCKGGCSASCLRQNTKYDVDGCIINKTLYPLIINSILNKDKLYKSIVKNYKGEN